MFGNNTYWWFGLLGFALFVGLNVLVWALRNRPKLSFAIGYSIAVFLLLYKIAEYIAYQGMGEHVRVPLEFSALSYFLFAILVTFRVKGADAFGCFVAMLAGMMYSFSIWISPDTHFANRDIWFLFVMAVVNHHLLYLGGALIVMNSRRFDPRQSWIFAVGTGLMVGYSWLLYGVTNYGEIYGKPIIISITDGSILLNLTHAESVKAWELGLWIPGALCLLALFAVAFYLLNRWQAKRRAKVGLCEDYFPSFRQVFNKRLFRSVYVFDERPLSPLYRPAAVAVEEREGVLGESQANETQQGDLEGEVVATRPDGSDDDRR